MIYLRSFPFFLQITLNSTTTIENLLKACAEEFLNIPKDNYDEEVKERNLELFLLDGKAIVKDPTYTFNRTSFHFFYTEVNYKFSILISGCIHNNKPF